MKAAVITQVGSLVANNVLLVDDWESVTPGANEIVVKTEASALNHLDLWVGTGMPGLGLEYPRISGSDGCGIVTAVGEDVDSSWIDSRVLLNAAVQQPEPNGSTAASSNHEIRMIGEHDHGTNAEYFVAPVSNVLDVGDVDPVEAAAFGLTHLTAWRMLNTRANFKEGQTVLITGIGGGVALAALNICTHMGCNTIVTSRHQWKLDRAMELGANESVLDDGEDWSGTVRAMTQKRGVDVCIDSIGGDAHLPILRSLARGGSLVTCGCTAGPAPTTDLARIFWNQLSVLGSTMGNMQEFQEAVTLLEEGMKPVIDSVHDSTNASEAFARLESGEQFGKIVITW